MNGKYGVLYNKANINEINLKSLTQDSDITNEITEKYNNSFKGKNHPNIYFSNKLSYENDQYYGYRITIGTVMKTGEYTLYLNKGNDINTKNHPITFKIRPYTLTTINEDGSVEYEKKDQSELYKTYREIDNGCSSNAEQKLLKYMTNGELDSYQQTRNALEYCGKSYIKNGKSYKYVCSHGGY